MNQKVICLLFFALISVSSTGCISWNKVTPQTVKHRQALPMTHIVLKAPLRLNRRMTQTFTRYPIYDFRMDMVEVNGKVIIGRLRQFRVYGTWRRTPPVEVRVHTSRVEYMSTAKVDALRTGIFVGATVVAIIGVGALAIVAGP